MLVVEELHIYPIKSLPGIQVPESRVMEKGLQYDRRLMLIDEDGRFMTQRTRPEMCRFNLYLHDDYITIIDKTNTQILPIEIKLNQYWKGETIRASIWNDEVEVIEFDSISSDWFSKIFRENCKLVIFPEQNNRRIDPEYSPEYHDVSLADGYPVLMISQESLDLLNSKLNYPVEINRFRPNIVCSGGKSHEEDFLRKFQIGTNIFAAVKPCARCSLTTVNPETGEVGVEPLKTLSSYRKVGQKVNFGINIIPLNNGQIRAGDEIRVL